MKNNTLPLGMTVARVGSATGGMAVRSPRILSKRLFVLIPTTNGAVQSKIENY